MDKNNHKMEIIKGEGALPIRSDRGYRMWQVRRGIYKGIASTMRKAARSFHVQVDGCAGAVRKRGGIVECKECGFYFKFTAEDAENLLNQFKEKEQ